MGRYPAVIVALFVMVSVAAVATPLSFVATGAVPSSLSVNITAPQQGDYLQTNYAVVSWEAVDTEHEIASFYVYLDELSAPKIVTDLEYNFTGLADGLHHVVVRAYNDVGGHAEAFVSFYVTSAAPALRITAPSSGDMLNYSDVTVTWQASDTVGIAYFEAQVDSQPWITPLPLEQVSNTFSDLIDGSHTVTVIAYSWSGKTATATVNFYIDTTQPSVAITQPDDGQGSSQANVTVQWTGTDAGNNIRGYQVWVDGAYTTFVAPSEDKFSLSYADGHHTVRIVVVDTANSTASDEVSFFVDTVAPGISVTSPEGSSVTIGSTIVVTFTKPMDPNLTSIVVTGVNGSVQWNGSSLVFTPEQPLQNGKSYTVTVVGKDMLGTSVTKTWTFTTVAADNPLSAYGMLAAVVGVVIVVILFYMSKMKKHEPPSRSWRRPEDTRGKKPRRGRKWDDEDEDDDELL